MLAYLNKFYNDGDIREKRAIIGSIFPEKLYFDDTGCRTGKINEGVELIYQIVSHLGRTKKRQAMLKIACPVW